MMHIESQDGTGLGVAMHLSLRGKTVTYRGPNGSGLIDKTDKNELQRIYVNEWGIYNPASDEKIRLLLTNHNFNRSILIASDIVKSVYSLNKSNSYIAFTPSPIYIPTTQDAENFKAAYPNINLYEVPDSKLIFIGRWFNGKHFTGPTLYACDNHHLEMKKDIYEDIEKLTKFLINIGFVGCVGIIYDSANHPLNIIPAPLQICEMFFELSNIPIDEILCSIWTQSNLQGNVYSWNVACSASAHCETGSPFFGLPEKHFWARHIEKVDKLIVARQSHIGNITAHGRNIREAERRASRILNMSALNLHLCL